MFSNFLNLILILVLNVFYRHDKRKAWQPQVIKYRLVNKLISYRRKLFKFAIRLIQDRISRISITSSHELRGKTGWRINLFRLRFRFPSGSIFILRMLHHVIVPESFRFVDERFLFRLRHRLPLDSQTFRDLGVVHLRVLLGHLLPLSPRPDHERVHWSLNLQQNQI